MKLNKILMALSAMAIVGCSSEDFDVPSATQDDDSRLIQLDESFVLAGVGEVNTTRTHWEQNAETGAFVNKFLPIYSVAPDGTKTLDQLVAGDNYETVGLCWLGQTPGAEVYTNYEFYHFGWLKKGETEADLENCDPVNLYNGAMYNEIKPATGASVDDEADETAFSYATGVTKGFAINQLNYNSGVYKTENKSIFGGQYIVYYPFNKDFKDAGTIPAAAETNWTAAKAAPVDAGTVKGWMAPVIGKETFRYSAPVTIEGGNKAANFGLYNLSAIVQLRLATAAGELTGASIVDQIVLYSASQKLLKKAYLAADKIVAGATGADLYASTEGTKTIVANPAAAIGFDAQGKPTKSAYITVLPTTVDDLVALVHKTDGKWAQISLGKTEFKAGSAKRLDIVVKAADFTTDFIAVDEASLTASLTAADGVVTADATARPQITVIGDITLATTPYDITTATYTNSDKITIKGDDIIVPEDVTLTLNTIMESKVRVLGKSCCDGTNGGIVDVQGGTISDVTMEPTEARVTAATYDALNPQLIYSAAATVAAGKTIDVQAGNVNVNDAVQHKGNIQIAKGAKVTVDAAGDLNFMGSTVVNNGTIEVKKNAHFDITDKDGNASWADGQNMENNGKFIHQVDANVGTTVQNMKQNGEYRCQVDKQQALNDAYVKWTACSVIEMVNSTVSSYDLASAKKHGDKYVDIEVNNGTTQTTFDETTPSDDKNIEIGNLTVTATSKGLKINYAPKSDGKQRELTVHGNMNVLYDSELTQSKKVTVEGNLAIDNNAILKYKGVNKNVGGLDVKKDITVTDATFDASDKDALEIKCKNFYLEKGAVANFGLRSEGNDKSTMTVDGTISNPKDCTFSMTPASGSDLLAWITCKKLTVGGAFPGGKPQVVE